MRLTSGYVIIECLGGCRRSSMTYSTRQSYKDRIQAQRIEVLELDLQPSRLPNPTEKMLRSQFALRSLQSSRSVPQSTILRSVIQRRLASTEGQPPLTGTADNAFNRERRAVKAHAAATSGELLKPNDELSSQDLQISGESYQFSTNLEAEKSSLLTSTVLLSHVSSSLQSTLGIFGTSIGTIGTICLL